MRKLIITALMAATILPSAAVAQSAGEVRRSERQLQRERQELREARQFGDRRDIREQRRDVREARQEFREDRRDYRQNWRRDDYRGYRQANPRLYDRGNWRSDYGYQTFRPGIRVQRGYYQPRYVIADYGRYRLPHPGYNQRWVRHYNDVLLIDTRRGYVIDVIRAFYR